MELNFVSLKYQLDTTNEQTLAECAQGLSEDDEVAYQREIFGIYDLDINVDNVIVILRYTNQYEYYASIIALTTLISLGVGNYETRKNLMSVQQMSKYSCRVNILRKDPQTNFAEFKQMSSTELVPGDIFELQEEGLAIPCDCLLIQGTVIINEAIYVNRWIYSYNKITNTKNKSHFNYDAYKKYFLFAGTKIIQKRSREKKRLIISLVTETSFSTIKGNLIRSILHPKKMDEKF